MFTDASSVGGGGFVEGGEDIFHFYWADSEKLTSSTYRELETFRRLLVDLSLPLRNKDLVWKCDNMNVVNILARGSMKRDLQFIPKEIFYIKNE